MSLDTYALATRAALKEYLVITGDDEDNLLERYLDRATDYIERYCNRKLKTRSYTKEIYWGNGSQYLELDQYPVTKVSRISMGRTNAFSVTNTGATTWATFEVTATGVTLNKDGTEVTTGLTFAGNATMTFLIAAINAVAGLGWTATLMEATIGAKKSSELLIRPGLSCKSPELAYAEMPDDELNDYHLLNPSEARNAGIIYYSAGFPTGTEIFIDYTGGVTSIPYALEDACLTLAAYKYHKSKQDPTLRSENLGDYGYTTADFKNALPPDLIEEINLFRRILI